MPHSASFARVSTPAARTATSVPPVPVTPVVPAPLSPAVRIALILVRAYQLLLSPFAGGACRFTPSCSAYALEALTSHGVTRGGWLALRRVAKCHPLGPSGIDPVPPAR
jgi:putative membrane protein insertion efficiency factor